MADEVIKTGNDELVEMFDGEVIDLDSNEGFTVKDGLLITAAGVVVGFAVKGVVDTVKWGKEKWAEFKEKRNSKKAGKKISKKQETEEIEDADYVEYEPDEESEEDVNGEE